MTTHVVENKQTDSDSGNKNAGINGHGEAESGNIKEPGLPEPSTTVNLLAQRQHSNKQVGFF